MAHGRVGIRPPVLPMQQGLLNFSSAVQPCLLSGVAPLVLQLRSPQPEPPGRKTRVGMCRAVFKEGLLPGFVSLSSKEA